MVHVLATSLLLSKSLKWKEERNRKKTGSERNREKEKDRSLLVHLTHTHTHTLLTMYTTSTNQETEIVLGLSQGFTFKILTKVMGEIHTEKRELTEVRIYTRKA